MKRKELDYRLPGVVEAMVENVLADERMRHLGRVELPSRDIIIDLIGKLRQVIFPGYFGKQGLSDQSLTYRIGELVNEMADPLYEQVRCCLRYREKIEEPNGAGGCDTTAAEIASAFLQRLPAVRTLLSGDVQAAFDSDPAARSTDETIFCYPGIFAIFVQRLSHELYKLDVPPAAAHHDGARP